MLVLDVARAVLMLAIAVHDARTRTLPNGLAIAFGIVCAVCGIARGGLSIFENLLQAAIVCGLLVALELFWRSRNGGSAGLGMGDIKYLFCLMLTDPALGVVSFMVGLLLLALAGTLFKKESLPLLPFTVGAYLAMMLLGSL